MKTEFTILVCPEHGMVDENDCVMELDLGFTHRPALISDCGQRCERVGVIRKDIYAFDAAVPLAELREENERLTTALNDALELAAEGWSYASEYFWDKWGAKEELDRLRAILALSATAQGEQS